METEITIIKKTSKEIVFKANVGGNLTICKVIKGKDCYVRVDDAFARINGYASLQDFKDKQPEFKKQLDMCMKHKDGYVWLFLDMEMKEFLGFNKNMMS